MSFNNFSSASSHKIASSSTQFSFSNIDTAANAKVSRVVNVQYTGISNTISAPCFLNISAFLYLLTDAGSPFCVKFPLVTTTSPSASVFFFMCWNNSVLLISIGSNSSINAVSFMGFLLFLFTFTIIITFVHQKEIANNHLSDNYLLFLVLFIYIYTINNLLSFT